METPDAEDGEGGGEGRTGRRVRPRGKDFRQTGGGLPATSAFRAAVSCRLRFFLRFFSEERTFGFIRPVPVSRPQCGVQTT